MIEFEDPRNLPWIEVRAVEKTYPLESGIRASLSRVFAGRPARRREVLRGLSFLLPKGRIVGLLGSNGCGKTTILRILSGITLPDKGRALLRGKVATVLGIENTLHPEMLVREAVDLQAALCQMPTDRLRGSKESILRTSGLVEDSNRPLKTLSPGMRARLVLSVILHAEWDVLLVDEIFATVDMEFRALCERQIAERVQRGASVLLVSHDLEWVSRFCTHVLRMENGRIRPEEVAPRKSSDLPTESPSESFLLGALRPVELGAELPPRFPQPI